MFSLSTTTAYALKALTCLDAPEGAYRGAAQVAEAADIPAPYLAKVFHLLARRGLVEGKRGPQGGFRLQSPLGAISMWEVVMATEGPAWNQGCALGLSLCKPGHPCLLHAKAMAMKSEMEEVLKRTMLSSLRTGSDCFREKALA